MNRHVKPIAFTLIELLVVVSIIALLISLVLPTLSMIRQTGRKVVCLSNQRQLGLALQIYMADSEYQIPPAFWPSGSAANRLPWVFALVRHAGGSAQPWVCPDSPGVDYLDELNAQALAMIGATADDIQHPWTGPAVPFGQTLFLAQTIGINEQPFAGETGSGQYMRLADIHSPSQMIYSGDVNGSYEAPYSNLAGFKPAPAVIYGNLNAPLVDYPRGWLPRHIGATNLLFIDGHAQTVPEDKLRSWCEAFAGPNYVLPGVNSPGARSKHFTRHVWY